MSASHALVVVQQRLQTLAALRESWLSWFEQQVAEKEQKALQERLALECLRIHGEELVAQQVAKRRRMQEQARKLEEQQKVAIAAAKAEAKKKKGEEKAAPANTAWLTGHKIAVISS